MQPREGGWRMLSADIPSQGKTQYLWDIWEHSILRLPVFAMGIIAGLQQLRSEEDQHHDKHFLHDIFPWTFTQEDTPRLSQEPAEQSWRKRVDRNGLVLVSIILISLLRSLLPGLPYLNIKTQFICVHLDLVVLVGLTRDGGQSWLAWMCR